MRASVDLAFVRTYALEAGATEVEAALTARKWSRLPPDERVTALAKMRQRYREREARSVAVRIAAQNVTRGRDALVNVRGNLMCPRCLEDVTEDQRRTHGGFCSDACEREYEADVGGQHERAER